MKNLKIIINEKKLWFLRSKAYQPLSRVSIIPAVIWRSACRAAASRLYVCQIQGGIGVVAIVGTPSLCDVMVALTRWVITTGVPIENNVIKLSANIEAKYCLRDHHKQSIGI